MTFRSPDDPYRDRKKVHMAALIRGDGAVSALCFKKPMRIVTSAATWTHTVRQVTCSACLKLIKERGLGDFGKETTFSLEEPKS